MKLITENGMVTFLMKVGKDKVKNQMSLKDASAIISSSQDVVETDTEMIVDDKYFFPAEKVKSRKKIDKEDSAQGVMGEEVVDNE